MTAVSKRTVFEGLVEAKKARERASNKIENLALELLSDPEAAILKINGSAQERGAPSHFPELSNHEALENLTGFGAFDPVAAAESEQEAIRQRKLRREIRIAQIKAGIDTEVTIGEVSGYRTICCYRMVRELARIKGQIGAEEALCDTNIFNSPQYVESGLTKGNWTEVGAEPIYRAREKTLEPLKEAIRELETYSQEPIPYEPPLKEGQEELLESFVYIMEELSDSLFLQRGSTVIPDYGILGTKGLFSSKLVGLIWPSRHELVTFEELLIEELIDVFVKKGEISARSHLMTKYGFLQHEATEIMHLAVRKTKDRVISDQETVRAKMILRLDHVVQEARESCDIRAELTGYRLLADITGLRNEVEDDAIEGIVQTIRSLKEKRESREFAASSQDMIE